MAIEIFVPRLGWSMDEGTFIEWIKQDGERVQAGDMLFVLEGDKAAEEVESFDAGILRIPPGAPKPGDEVRVGQVLAYLVGEGEPAPFEIADHPAATKGQKLVEPNTASAATQTPAPVPGSTRGSSRSRVAISPRARRAARELGVDWADIQGTGRNGRIRERDIRALGSARGKHGESSLGETLSGRTMPLSRIRRTIAQRMCAGVQQAAPVTLTTKADATSLVQLKTHLRGGDEAPSYTNLIVKLAAATLELHPLLKAQWRDDEIFIPDSTNIAFAVETEAGLLAPVIRDVPGRTIEEVASESRRLIELARDRRLHTDQLQGATFTVTNLGGFGIDAFTPILHLPQSAILGVGRIVREPVVTQDDAIVPRDMMSLSLTFDHRVLDGAPAARFLDALRQSIEDPEMETDDADTRG